MSLQERISNMEIINGGKLTNRQMKVIVEHRITTVIHEQLYLGSLADAWDLSQLRFHKITHIIQLLYDITSFPKASGIKYYHISLMDDVSEDILPVFKEYVPIIDQIIKSGGRVL